jgi:hypothetical protein
MLDLCKIGNLDCGVEYCGVSKAVVIIDKNCRGKTESFHSGDGGPDKVPDKTPDA